MLKKVSQMNQKDVPIVGHHVKKVALAANVRCMTQLVLNVALKQKFLSSQQAKDQFIAAIASRKKGTTTKI